LGLEPKWEGGAAKWDRPESAQVRKEPLGLISLMFFPENYEISFWLHSDGLNELMG